MGKKSRRANGYTEPGQPNRDLRQHRHKGGVTTRRRRVRPSASLSGPSRACFGTRCQAELACAQQASAAA
jgi:hypothetical protein